MGTDWKTEEIAVAVRPAIDVVIGMDIDDVVNAAQTAEHCGLIKPLAGMVKRLLVQVSPNRNDINDMIGGAIFGPPCKFVISEGASRRLSNRDWLILSSSVRGANVYRLRWLGFQELQIENGRPVVIQDRWTAPEQWAGEGCRGGESASSPRKQAPLIMAIGPGPLPEHLWEQMRDYDPANMWRWEKWDFANRKVHLSCPVCYRLAIADLQLVLDTVKIRDTHNDCTFEGYVAFEENGHAELQAWKGGAAGGISGIGENAMRPDKIINAVIGASWAPIPMSYGRAATQFMSEFDPERIDKNSAQVCKERGMHGNFDPFSFMGIHSEAFEKAIATEFGARDLNGRLRADAMKAFRQVLMAKFVNP